MVLIAMIVALILEVFAVGAMSYAGFRLPVSLFWRFLLGIILPIAVIVFWAGYMAPKARNRLKNPYYLLAKAVIYAITAIFLAIIGHTTIALIFAVVAMWDEVILFYSQRK